MAYIFAILAFFLSGFAVDNAADSGSQDGSDSDSANGSGSQQEAGSTGSDDSEKDPRIKRANEEAAKYRIRARDAETEIKSLKAQIAEREKQIGEEVSKGFTDRIERLEKQLADAENNLKSADIQSRRATIASKHGLDPDLLSFVTADEDEDITKQVVTLVEKSGKTQKKSRAKAGNNDGSDNSFSLEQIEKMSPEDVAANLDKVTAALKRAQKK